MLRNRSRAVTRKQAIMGDQTPIPPPPSENQAIPISSFFGSPRFFNGFFGKGFFETETTMSPTSVLHTKPFSVFPNPLLGHDQNPVKFPTTFPENKHSWEKENSEPQPIGLALVDSLTDENNNNSKPKTRMVLFGSKLKIRIPPSPGISLPDPDKSPTDFGIKTKNSNLPSPFGSANSGNQTINGSLTVREMELSEDYTCVINHGPNPRTTHIYDNCVVNSHCSEVAAVGSTGSRNEFNSLFSDNKNPKYPTKNFLSYCYTCKMDLGPGNDIFIYRGEKAFCSCECRLQEILFDEEKNVGY